MNWLMLSLKKRLPFLEAKWFQVVYGLIVFLNPLAILPQLLGIIRTHKEAGVSVMMFVIFAFIQTAIALGAIRTSDWKLWLSMTISVVESVTIIVMVGLIRYTTVFGG